MFEKKYFSTKHDFKTGFYFKLCFVIGIFLLSIFIFLKIISFLINENSGGILKSLYDFSQGTTTDSVGAFSIIFIALGFIIYFLHVQFVKLNEIAEDIKKNPEYKDEK